MLYYAITPRFVLFITYENQAILLVRRYSNLPRTSLIDKQLKGLLFQQLLGQAT